MEAQQSLIVEIEGAIASGSPERRVETLRRVTDLFVGRAGDYSDVQVELFDEVILRLANRIETKAKEELANRLAPVGNAPREVIRTLARDESIEVAGPILTHSERLTEEDLLDCARSTGQDRLLAISKRTAISEAISDVLVERGDREVVRSVASNDGARFSDTGFGKLVQKSSDDEELAVSVGMRRDVPKQHFQALVSKASEAVYKRLSAANPEAAAEVQRVLFDLTGRDAAAVTKVDRDYTQANSAIERLQKSGNPMEPAINEFARAGKMEEVIVALAALCRLSVEVVERLMTDPEVDNDLVLILAKAAGLGWLTAKVMLALRRGERGMSPQDVEIANRHFNRLQHATAQRVVRFYQVRQLGQDQPPR